MHEYRISSIQIQNLTQRMLPQQPYPPASAPYIQPMPQQAPQMSYEGMRNRLTQLANVNQDLSSANHYYVKELSYLQQKIKLLEAENKRLLNKQSEGEGALTKRSNMSLEGITDQVNELAERLSETKRESEEKLSFLAAKNRALEEQIRELQVQDNVARRSLNESSKMKILTLEIEKKELERDKQDNHILRSAHTQDSRFKKRDANEEAMVSSVGVSQLLKQGSMSSVDLMNSSQQSYLKEDMIQDLKQQNQILRSELIENNRRFQAQIQKLNEVINKLLSKQSQVQPLKITISTLFNALTVSYIDFSNEVALYQKKIVALLQKMSQMEEGFREQISRLNRRVALLQEQLNLRK